MRVLLVILSIGLGLAGCKSAATSESKGFGGPPTKQSLCNTWTGRTVTADVNYIGQGKHDQYRIEIAAGNPQLISELFDIARSRLNMYQQYPKDLIDTYVCREPAVIDMSATIIQNIKIMGVTFETANRVIKIIDEDDAEKRYYAVWVASVQGHKERGVVQYILEWNKTHQKLYYRIETYSESGHWTTTVGSPVARSYQVEYSNKSLQHMKQTVINTHQRLRR